MNFYYRSSRSKKRKKYTYKDFVNLSSNKIKEKLNHYVKLKEESEKVLEELIVLKKHFATTYRKVDTELDPYITAEEKKITEGKDLIFELHNKGETGLLKRWISKEDFKPGYEEKIKTVEEALEVIRKNINAKVERNLPRFPSKTFILNNKEYTIALKKGDIRYRHAHYLPAGGSLNHFDTILDGRPNEYKSSGKINDLPIRMFNDLSHHAMKQKFESERYIKPLEKALSIVEKKHVAQEEKLTKEKDKADKYKAHAYAYQDKSRELADEIKKELKSQTDIFINCPYCEQPLGEIPHADHIYPVSKGGLSTKENMVYVCEKCNLEKRDLTLREFIKKKDFNRSKIEENLEKLHKQF